MEKLKSLCYIREIYQAIAEFESNFQKTYNICFNEGMTLCSLKEKPMSSGELATMLGLSNSNTSKVLKSVEEKGFVERIIGENDHRKMYFTLSEAGRDKISSINCEEDKMPFKLKELMKNVGLY